MSALLGKIDVARAYQPFNAMAYLRTRGWSQVEEIPYKFSMWRKVGDGGGDNESFEILLPLALEAPDLARRVVELVDTLCVQESRPVEDVWEDLNSPYADIIRTRLVGDGDGVTLPLEDGSAAFQFVRELLLAAACAATRPKAVYGSRKPEPAMEVIRQARLGQTQPGSYIIKIIAPLMTAPTNGSRQTSLWHDDEPPFTRVATTMLATGLQEALDVVRESAGAGRIDRLHDRINQGVSANFCDALAGLGRISRSFELDFSWASAQPQRTNVRNHFVVPCDAAAHFSAVAHQLRQTTTLEDAQFFGSVHSHTFKEPDADEVVLTGTVNGVPRSVRVAVEGDERRTLLNAFENRRLIACIGEVAKDGRFYRMHNLRELAIVPTDAGDAEQSTDTAETESASNSGG